jgi:putative hydrolase of the HAD superfamily
MIQNLLLDLGNVTVRYDPVEMTAPWVESNADLNAIVEALFFHPDWGLCDAGRLTEAQLFENARARLPQRLHPALKNVLLHWPEYMTPLPGAEAFLKTMKSRGFRLIALSNAPERYAEFKVNMPILKYFDGEVISALVGFAKPGREIFEYALSTFSMKPDECFFVDDLPHNVEGAARAGIAGCVFHGDYEALMALIDQMNGA